jgi:hypothetical protein
MKYVLLIILIAACVFVSCKKTNSTNTSVMFYNATWSLPAITAAWNGSEIIATAIAQGQSSGTAASPYIQVPAGTNLITLKAGTNTLLDKNIYASAAAGSSFVFFDTSTIAAPVRVLQLKDDLSLPDTAQLKYRILTLVPDAGVKVDIWLVNGATDSIRLDTAGSFIGTTAVASSVESFTAIKYHGENYKVKVKKTGTEQLYVPAIDYSFAIKGIYSIIFSGLPTGAGSTAFKLSVLRHPAQ